MVDFARVFARAVESLQHKSAVAEDLISQFPTEVYHAVAQTHSDDIGYPTLFELEREARNQGYKIGRNGNRLSFTKNKE
jgi:hypothetical protein